MRVRLVIDGATYQYEDLTDVQFDAVRRLLSTLSAGTMYPTGKIADDDRRLAEAQSQPATFSGHKERIEAQNVEIERQRNELGRRHQQLVEQQQEIRSLRQQLEQLTAELDALRYAQPQPAPPVYVPWPWWPYPPIVTCPTDTTIRITCSTEAKQ